MATSITKTFCFFLQLLRSCNMNVLPILAGATTAHRKLGKSQTIQPGGIKDPTSLLLANPGRGEVGNEHHFGCGSSLAPDPVPTNGWSLVSALLEHPFYSGLLPKESSPCRTGLEEFNHSILTRDNWETHFRKA